jgi:hypothetical protein
MGHQLLMGDTDGMKCKLTLAVNHTCILVSLKFNSGVEGLMELTSNTRSHIMAILLPSQWIKVHPKQKCKNATLKWHSHG